MKSFLWKLHLYKFLDAFTLIFPVFTLLFQKAGLSTLQISLLILVWSVTTIVLEVPTGVLADRYSRRNLMVIASIARALCFGLWFIGGFWLFAVGFVFWGIKNTLVSGTFEAFVYDELKMLQKEQEYEKINGQLSGSRFLGVTTSALLGGIVAQQSFPLTLILSIVTTLLGGGILFFIKPAKITKSTGEVKYWQTFKEALLHTKTNSVLLFTILLICAIFGIFSAIDEFYALIYAGFGFSISAIGIFIAINNSFYSLAGYTVSFYRQKRLEYVLILTSGIFLFIAGVLKIPIVALLAIFAAAYFLQVSNIKIEAALQHHISANQRATIFSIKSFLFEFVYLFFVFIFGLFSDKFGTISVLFISGVTISIGVLLFASLEKNLSLTS